MKFRCTQTGHKHIIAWKLFLSWQLQRWWQGISVKLNLTVWDSEVLTAVLLNVPALLHVTPCQLVISVLFISLDKFTVNRMSTQNSVLSKNKMLLILLILLLWQITTIIITITIITICNIFTTASTKTITSRNQ
jgi:hypothetical protein